MKYYVQVEKVGCIFVEAPTKQEAMFIADHQPSSAIDWDDDWKAVYCEEDDTQDDNEYVTERAF